MNAYLPVGTLEKVPTVSNAPTPTLPASTPRSPQTSSFASLPFRLPHLSSLAALGVGEMLGFFFFAIYQQIVWS